MSAWISVKDKLPPWGVTVECISARSGITKGRRMTNSFDGVTLWMQPPGDPYGDEITHWRYI